MWGMWIHVDGEMNLRGVDTVVAESFHRCIELGSELNVAVADLLLGALARPPLLQAFLHLFRRPEQVLDGGRDVGSVLCTWVESSFVS